MMLYYTCVGYCKYSILKIKCIYYLKITVYEKVTIVVLQPANKKATVYNSDLLFARLA